MSSSVHVLSSFLTPTVQATLVSQLFSSHTLKTDQMQNETVCAPNVFHDDGSVISDDCTLTTILNDIVTPALQECCRRLEHKDDPKKRLFSIKPDIVDCTCFSVYRELGSDVGGDAISWHTDDSVLTLNICLGIEGEEVSAVRTCVEFEGGQGMYDVLTPGSILVHPGVFVHRVRTIANTASSTILQRRRRNIVIYCLPKVKQASLQAEPFGVRYRKYLGAKYTMHITPHSTAFDVITLPPYLERWVQKILNLDHTTGTQQLPTTTTSSPLKTFTDRVLFNYIVTLNICEYLPPMYVRNFALTCRLAAERILPEARERCWQDAYCLSAKTRRAGTGAECVPTHQSSSKRTIFLASGRSAMAMLCDLQELIAMTQSSNSPDLEEGTYKPFPKAMPGMWHMRESDENGVLNGIACGNEGMFSDVFSKDSAWASKWECRHVWSSAWKQCCPPAHLMRTSIEEELRRLMERHDTVKYIVNALDAGPGLATKAGSCFLEMAKQECHSSTVVTFPITCDMRWQSVHDAPKPTHIYNTAIAMSNARQYSTVVIPVSHAALHALRCDAEGIRCGLPFDVSANCAIAANTIRVALNTYLDLNDGCLTPDDLHSISPYPELNYAALSTSGAQRKCYAGSRSCTEICTKAFECVGMYGGSPIGTVGLHDDQIVQTHSAPLSKRGLFMSCSMMFHGDITPKDVMTAVASIKTKRSIQFVDWCPTGFKCSITYQAPVTKPLDPYTYGPRCAGLVTTNTAFGDMFQNSFVKIGDKMLAKKAYLHTGGEYWGDDYESDVTEALHAMRQVVTDYEEVVKNEGQVREDDD